MAEVYSRHALTSLDMYSVTYRLHTVIKTQTKCTPNKLLGVSLLSNIVRLKPPYCADDVTWLCVFHHKMFGFSNLVQSYYQVAFVMYVYQ